MSDDQPQIQDRPAQPYVGLPATVSMPELPGAVDRGFPELFGWLASHQLSPSGPPFIRYLEIDMPARLEIELGVPVDGEPPAGERIRRGVLPAGRYATLMHVGPYDGLIGANAALQQWASEQGIAWRMEGGSVWGGRIERYLTDPSRQPDPSSWKTELAYLITD